MNILFACSTSTHPTRQRQHNTPDESCHLWVCCLKRWWQLSRLAQLPQQHCTLHACAEGVAHLKHNNTQAVQVNLTQAVQGSSRKDRTGARRVLVE